MKSIKLTLLSTVLALGSIFAIVASCNPDKCKDVTCQNGGTCNDGNCTCTTGYEGANCETLSRTKFIGSWSASDKTGSTTLPYTAAIAAGSATDVTEVLIGLTFSDGFFTVGPTIKASISGSTITIPNQNPDGNYYSLSGSGTLANNTITWSYTIKNDNTSATQVYSGTWTK